MKLNLRNISTQLVLTYGVASLLFLSAVLVAVGALPQEAGFERMLSLTLAIGALLFGILALFWLPHRLKRDLRHLSTALHAMSEGSAGAKQHQPLAVNGELNELAQAINSLIESMGSRFKEAREAGSRLAAAASEVSSDADDVNDEIGRQHTQVDMVVAAIDQMTVTFQEVARNTSEASQAAIAAKSGAENGTLQASNAIGAIEQLEHEIQSITNVIHKVKQESINIGTVLDVIRDISEQTNLLALNAAIEAARAGDQGRGFAVVADEVRTLATRTGSSTQEIEQMIKTLDQETTAAVSAMESATSQAKGSVGSVEQAAAALGEISNAINQISDMNAQVATATEQQSTVAEEVNRSIVSIAQITERVASDSQQMTETSDKLLREMGSLNRLLGG